MLDCKTTTTARLVSNQTDNRWLFYETLSLGSAARNFFWPNSYVKKFLRKDEGTSTLYAIWGLAARFYWTSCYEYWLYLNAERKRYIEEKVSIKQIFKEDGSLDFIKYIRQNFIHYPLQLNYARNTTRDL